MTERKLKASEVRVGNKIISYDENWKEIIATVSLICETHYCVQEHNSVMSWDHVKPIPLTEEMLMKLGFKKDELNNCIYISIPMIKTEIHFEAYAAGLVCVIQSSTGSLIPNDIEYAHDLQNLYKALAKKELIYNPSTLSQGRN